jgi:hypothetical protein
MIEEAPPKAHVILAFADSYPVPSQVLLPGIDG